MSKDDSGSQRPSHTAFHPFAYGALGFAALWFVLAVWEFSDDSYTDYLLVIVSGFIVTAAAIPSILWHVGKSRTVVTHFTSMKLRVSTRNRFATGHRQSLSHGKGDLEVKRSSRGAVAYRSRGAWHDGIRHRFSYCSPSRHVRRIL